MSDFHLILSCFNGLFLLVGERLDSENPEPEPEPRLSGIPGYMEKYISITRLVFIKTDAFLK